MMEVVVVESAVHFTQEFGGRLQVDLGGADIHMAHVSGQRRKPRIDIFTVPIPGQQPMDREGMPKVMDARPVTSRPWNVALVQQLPECLTHRKATQAMTAVVEQQRRVGGVYPLTHSTILVLLQGASC